MIGGIDGNNYAAGVGERWRTSQFKCLTQFLASIIVILMGHRPVRGRSTFADAACWPRREGGLPDQCCVGVDGPDGQFLVGDLATSHTRWQGAV